MRPSAHKYGPQRTTCARTAPPGGIGVEVGVASDLALDEPAHGGGGLVGVGLRVERRGRATAVGATRHVDELEVREPVRGDTDVGLDVVVTLAEVREMDETGGRARAVGTWAGGGRGGGQGGAGNSRGPCAVGDERCDQGDGEINR